MRRALALASALCLAGCAGASGSSPAPGSSVPAARLLQRADDQLATAQYRGAIALYDEFLKTYPTDAAAARARASRALIDRLLLSQGEIERLRREVDTRQAEIDRLKADLERLRRIDLRQAPAVR